MDKFKDNLKKFDADIYSKVKMNVGHHSGSFLDPYSDQEKRLVQRLQEKDIVFEEYIMEDEQSVSAGNKEHMASKENVGVAGNEEHVDNEG
ncbi:hypothetical protein MKW98_025400, partial [Papaver atlanticum]